ncbi:hypothetical protein B0T09DRAFT_67031 [Sordaria sp. MPI-SDFR-AT-0083]|nr:hypothetical protein B0T09DRAFT_67031 [Sordaria sp. MPI-SDFR-AT-0083]
MKDVEATWQFWVASVVFSAQLSMHAISPKNTSCLPIHPIKRIDIQCPYNPHITPPPYPPQLMDLSHQEDQRGSSSPEARIVRLKTEPGTSTRKSPPRPSSSSNATTSGSSNRPVQPPKVCDKCRLRSEYLLVHISRSDSTSPEHMA